MKANLLYHICPMNNPMLVFNLEQLGQYWKVFTGRKIINIASGAGLLPSGEVRKMLKEHGCTDAEIIVSGNDPTRETKIFMEKLLPAVKSDSASEVSFFAHSKGITQPESQWCRKWAEYMYRFNLKDVKKVFAVLVSHTFAGIFKTGKCPPVVPTWHYSGTFFWFNHKKLYGLKTWNNIEMGRWGVEAYPGTQVASTDAACLAYPNMGGRINSLYLPNTWKAIEEGEALP
jgi:hypothetical protein